MDKSLLLGNGGKYRSLEEQLSDENYIISPCFGLDELPDELIRICGRDFRESITYDFLVLPKWLLRGDDVEDRPVHQIFMRKKDDSSGRFVPDYGVKFSGRNYDDMLKRRGFAGHVIENDVFEKDFFGDVILQMLRGNFGENFHLIPSQIALMDSPLQFKKKSYILYHDNPSKVLSETYIGVDLRGRNVPFDYSSI